MFEKMFCTAKAVLDKYVAPLNNWASKEKRPEIRLVKSLILCMGLLVACSVLALVVGLASIRFPRICSFLILACVISLPILLILAVVMPRKSTGLLRDGLVLSFMLGAFVVGSFAFVGLPWPRAIGARLFSNSFQCPLGGLRGIAVDRDGSIYLALTAYSRIQKYSSEGQFMHGWYVGTRGLRFGIWAEDDHEDTIHVLLGARAQDVYDSDGIFLERRTFASPEERRVASERALGTVVANAGGTIYQIESSAWSPKVSRITPDAKKTTVIRDSFHHHLVRAPRPAFDLMFVALLMGTLHGGLLALKTTRFRYLGRAAPDAERDDQVTRHETVTHVEDGRRADEA